ncbi:MAG TPA: AarF/ABC1/UbiB kinase family protein, partial [Solirubrobacteraceae bacterium]|nr:AarF/ABC1/UbiB kinase family protein [Solirubrobacteraceae bacterium]
KDMRKVLEAEYGDKLDAVFESFDPVPIAAASIGQVYKATLDDGRHVEVKVQYPGVAAAVRADMQNLGVIMRLLKSVFPGLDVKAMGDEIRERIHEELDYELEASNQKTLARIFKGHPFIYIPDVVTSLSHEKVVVTEFVDGRGFEELKQLPQEERNRIGEIIYRFYYGSMYRHRQFSGDPHPGNSMLMDDGRMAFLDFGLFKRIPQSVADSELRIGRAGIEGDAGALLAALSDGGFLRDASGADPEKLLAQFRDLTWWYTEDEEVLLTPAVATQVMIDMSDPRSQWYGQMRHESVPADHVFGRRLETLTLAVLSQLGARNNWHRIAREWVYGDDPVTELGRQEAEFYRSRAGALA